MDENLKREVLTEYRQLRGAGPAPYVVMGMLRDGAANLITESVVRGLTPPGYLLDRWQIATDYLNSMAKRPSYWWKPARPVIVRPARHHRLWRNRSPYKSRRTTRS